MGLFGNRGKTSGLNQTNVDVTIDVKNDGFHLKAASRGDVTPGDVLLISYNTPSTGWVRKEIIYQEERKGMFIFTGEKPEGIVVLSLRNLQHSRNLQDVRGSVWQNRTPEHRNDESYDLTSPINLFSGNNSHSPFHLLCPLNPLSVINIFSGSEERESGRTHHIHNEDRLVLPKDDFPLSDDDRSSLHPNHHHHGHTGAVDHLPGSDPFQGRGLDLEKSSFGEGLKDERDSLHGDGGVSEENTSHAHAEIGSDNTGTYSDGASSSTEPGAYS